LERGDDVEHLCAQRARVAFVDIERTVPEGEQELLRRQCLKRKLLPQDVARVVLFFAADDSGACTNQSYVVDGGWV